jgi:hypothetical protein
VMLFERGAARTRVNMDLASPDAASAIGLTSPVPTNVKQ